MTESRKPTAHERNIAHAWVSKHRWTNRADATVEYEHALAILVFASPTVRTCIRCRHPYDWHRIDDRTYVNGSLMQRCLGYDPGVDGPLSSCDCPDLLPERASA